MAVEPPLVVGGVGGSGTGVVARMIALVRYMGVNLNPAYDALDLSAFDWRWGRRFVAGRLGIRPAAPEAAMRADLRACIGRHLAPLRGGMAPWGWKHPHAILMLPFLHRTHPRMTFVHVIRDGRDMAYSRNRNQVNRYADLLCEPGSEELPAVRAMAYWAWANSWAADHGEVEMGDRYLRVRFEDVCSAPAATAARLLAFAGADLPLSADMTARAARLVEPPASLERWRSQPQHDVARVSREGDAALRRFCYKPAARRGSGPSLRTGSAQ
jgi:hypothetical protein